jgi:hypothetical protein
MVNLIKKIVSSGDLKTCATKKIFKKKKLDFKLDFPQTE